MPVGAAGQLSREEQPMLSFEGDSEIDRHNGKTILRKRQETAEWRGGTVASL